MTFEVVKEEFKDFLLLECAFSKHTIDAYMRNIEKFENFLNKNGLKLSDVVTQHLHRFIIEIAEAASPASQAQIVATVKAFFKFLVSDGMLSDSPAELLQTPKKDLILPCYLTISEVHTLLKCASFFKPFPFRSTAIIATLYATGVRVSELLHVKFDDLLFDIDAIKVLGKGNKERLVPISPFAQKHILAYIDNERILFEKTRDFNSYVFISEKGKALQREYVWQLVKTLSNKAGITKSISPHTLRHTLATHLKQAGADLHTIKDILGHENISDTIRYTHLDTASLQDAIKLHPVNKYEYPNQ